MCKSKKYVYTSDLEKFGATHQTPNPKMAILGRFGEGPGPDRAPEGECLWDKTGADPGAQSFGDSRPALDFGLGSLANSADFGAIFGPFVWPKPISAEQADGRK